MRLSEFDFDLPQSHIALRPASPRDSARLLEVPADQGTLGDHIVRDLPNLLQPGDLMVFNDTRTLPAALTGSRAPRAQGGGTAPVSIEFNLHKRTAANTWQAFARPAKRVAPGDTISFTGGLLAEVSVHAGDGEVTLLFDQSGPALDAAIAVAGVMPLPPYIARKRAVDQADKADYQTVYARVDGSVATPTAGLHFTDALLANLKQRGVEMTWLTLHVGAGTFLPVKVDNVADHVMHAETYEVSVTAADTINQAKGEGRRVIAVGTTSLRTLESVATPDRQVVAGAGDTAIFITPGHKFNIADGLMTNFHLPKSTLMMLVSAFAGHARTMSAYRHAIESNYRFYSYGDASLFWRSKDA